MKTYKQLKDFCETKKVRHEVNPLYSKPYEYLAVEDGKVVWKEGRTLLGFEIGMCNIAGRTGIVYGTLKECAEKNGISPTQLGRYLRGEKPNVSHFNYYKQ